MEEQAQPVPGGGGNGPKRGIGVDLMDENPHRSHMLPVWFFIGVILLIYGILIFITGLYELAHPAETVLAGLHAAVWWGAFIAIVGAIYVWIFRPKKN